MTGHGPAPLGAPPNVQHLFRWKQQHFAQDHFKRILSTQNIDRIPTSMRHKIVDSRRKPRQYFDVVGAG